MLTTAALIRSRDVGEARRYVDRGAADAGRTRSSGAGRGTAPRYHGVGVDRPARISPTRKATDERQHER